LEFTPPKVHQVLEVLSDGISVNIFEIIESNAKKATHLKQELNLSTKQFYDRVQKLMDAGLVKRRGLYYHVTSFGSATLQAYAKIAKGIEYLPEFKIIDSIANGDVPWKERMELIDRLVEDLEIKTHIEW
jgi:predicted transcriptional regulator